MGALGVISWGMAVSIFLMVSDVRRNGVATGGEQGEALRVERVKVPTRYLLLSYVAEAALLALGGFLLYLA